MAKSLYISGTTLEIQSGTSSGYSEITLDNEYEFYGIIVMLENPVFGDELDFKINAPDNSEVRDYSTNTFLTSKVNLIEIKTSDRDDPAELPAGFKLKIIYNAIDTNGRKAIFWYRLKK